MLIAFEGLEGAGKTTLGQAMASVLPAVYLKSPPAEMDCCRGFIAQANSPSASFYFYMAALYAMQSEIEAAIVAGRPVIVDRYLASTIAYHAAGGTFDPPAFDRSGLRRPDLVVHIRCDEPVRVERVASRGFHIFDRAVCNEPAIDRYFSAVADMSFDNDARLSESVDQLSALLSDWLAENVKPFC